MELFIFYCHRNAVGSGRIFVFAVHICSPAVLGVGERLSLLFAPASPVNQMGRIPP